MLNALCLVLKRKMNKDIPFVMMVDINYVPGLMALLESIRLNGDLPENQKFIVIECEKLSNKDRDLIKRIGLNLEFIDQQDYSDVSIDWFDDWADPELFGMMRKFLKKLYVFNMTEYEKIIYIDTDLVCIGSIKELLSMEPLSARLDYAAKQAMAFEHKQFNAGLMVISPSTEDFNGLIKTLQENTKKLLNIKPCGDQVLINYYFWTNKPETIHLIDWKWGINKRTVKDQQILKEHMKDARLIHYVGFKPWWGLESEEYREIDEVWHWAWKAVKKRLNNKEI